MLVQHLGPPRRGQLPCLLGLLPEIDRSGSQFQFEVDCFALQFACIEFQAMSLRRGLPSVNARRLSDTR